MATQLEQIRDFLQTLVGTAGVDDLDTLLGAIDANTEALAKDKTLVFWPKTGSAAIAETLAPGAAWQLHEVRLFVTAGPGGSGTFTVTEDNGVGAAYDQVHFSQDMTAQSNVRYAPDVPLAFEAADELDFAWANGGGKTYGLRVIYSLR